MNTTDELATLISKGDIAVLQNSDLGLFCDSVPESISLLWPGFVAEFSFSFFRPDLNVLVSLKATHFVGIKHYPFLQNIEAAVAIS